MKAISIKRRSGLHAASQLRHYSTNRNPRRASHDRDRSSERSRASPDKPEFRWHGTFLPSNGSQRTRVKNFPLLVDIKSYEQNKNLRATSYVHFVWFCCSMPHMQQISVSSLLFIYNCNVRQLPYCSPLSVGGASFDNIFIIIMMTWNRICIYICTYMCMYIFMYIYFNYVSIHICINICINMYSRDMECLHLVKYVFALLSPPWKASLLESNKIIH